LPPSSAFRPALGINRVTNLPPSEVLAADLGIPLQSLNAVDRIESAIDGAMSGTALQYDQGEAGLHMSKEKSWLARRAEAFSWWVVGLPASLVERLIWSSFCRCWSLPSAWRQQ